MRHKVIPTRKGAKMEGKGKQNCAANTMNTSNDSRDIGVVPKHQVLIGDQSSCEDEELIIHYLDKKMIDQRFPNHTVHEVDFFLYHPLQLTQMHSPSQEKEWYFLSPASKKDTKRGQSKSENSDGYWETCGTVCLIHKDGKLIGYRKTLKYVEGKQEKDKEKPEWLMHEYRLDRGKVVRTGTTSDEVQKWVVCKLFEFSENFIAAEEKKAVKFAGPDDGESSMDQTIQGSEKANSTINDKGPITGDSLPLADTDQGAVTPYSLLDQARKIWSLDKPLTDCQPGNDQGTTLPTPTPQQDQTATVTPTSQQGQTSVVTPTPQQGQTTTATPTGRRKAAKKAVTSKRPTYRRKRGSLPLLDSDQGFVMPQLLNANYGPQHDHGAMVPPPLPQNNLRRVLPTFTGTYNVNIGVITDKGPSNSLNVSQPLTAASQGFMIPNFDLTSIRSFGGTTTNSWHQHGTVLPSRPQHGQQTILPQHYQQAMLPRLTGIQSVKSDGFTPVTPAFNRYYDARNLPPSVQVPTPPSGDFVSEFCSYDDEVDGAEMLRNSGWPFATDEAKLPSFLEPFDSLTADELAFFDCPDPGYPGANENNKEAQVRIESQLF